MNCRTEVFIVAAGLLLAFDVYFYRREAPKMSVLSEQVDAMKAAEKVFAREIKDGNEMYVDMLSERTLDLWEKKIVFFMVGIGTILALGFVAYLLVKAEVKRRYRRDDTLNSINAMLGLHKRDPRKRIEGYHFSILHLVALMVATACICAACAIPIY